MIQYQGLLFAIAICISAEISTDELYPRDITRPEFRIKCPLEFHKFEGCIPKYKNCFNQLREVKDCNKEFGRCMEIIRDDENADEHDLNGCNNYTNNAVFYAWTHGISIQKTVFGESLSSVYLIRKRLEPMETAITWVAKECGIESKLQNEMKRIKVKANVTSELLNSVLPYFALRWVEFEMSNSKSCRESVKKLENVMEMIDAQSAKNLEIPYDFWNIGTAFGAMGKVTMRVIADETCEQTSDTFNHLGAIFLNCYDQQLAQKECDEKYIEGLESVLSTKDSKKVNCKLFVDLVKSLLSIGGVLFYKEAASYYVEGSTVTFRGKFNKGFSGFLNGSMTSRDTKSTIVVLGASTSTSIRQLDYFDRVSSECGASRSIVSSCGFMFERCTHFSHGGCPQQLTVCLNGILNMTDECQKAISQLTNLVWPTVQKSETITSEADEKQFAWTLWAAMGAALLVGIAVFAIFCFILQCCKSEKETSIEVVPMELQSFLGRQPISRDPSCQDVELPIIKPENDDNNKNPKSLHGFILHSVVRFKAIKFCHF
uniref:Chondroitin proteoglycan 4 domain-containing protein n=1 Tax=Caenorhabditis japonica TaxID=281687 RepID=A0A8R1HKD6_CAEJA